MENDKILLAIYNEALSSNNPQKAIEEKIKEIDQALTNTAPQGVSIKNQTNGTEVVLPGEKDELTRLKLQLVEFVEVLDGSNKDGDRHIVTQQVKLIELNLKNNALTDQVKAKDETIVEKDRVIGEKEKIIEEKDQTITGLKATVEQRDIDVRGANEEIANLNIRLQKQGTEVGRVTQQNEILQGQVTQLEKDLAGAKEYSGVLEVKIDGAHDAAKKAAGTGTSTDDKSTLQQIVSNLAPFSNEALKEVTGAAQGKTGTTTRTKQ